MNDINYKTERGRGESRLYPRKDLDTLQLMSRGRGMLL